MIGQEFEIPEEFKKIVSENMDAINKHQRAMDYHAGALNLESKKFWATIGEIMPELETEKYGCVYDNETNKIRYQKRNY